MGSQEVISDDQRFQQLRSNKFLSKVIYSQDLQWSIINGRRNLYFCRINQSILF